MAYLSVCSVVFVRIRIGFDVEQDRFERLVVQHGSCLDHSFHRIYGEISDCLIRMYSISQRVRIVQACIKQDAIYLLFNINFPELNMRMCMYVFNYMYIL